MFFLSEILNERMIVAERPDETEKIGGLYNAKYLFNVNVGMITI